jgi:hypothetical protein
MNSISSIVFSLVLVLSVQNLLTKYLLVELEGKFQLLAVFTQGYCTYYKLYGLGYCKFGFRLKTTSKYIGEQITHSVEDVERVDKCGWVYARGKRSYYCGQCPQGAKCYRDGGLSTCGACDFKGGLNK